jgi:chromosome segregation ATPase
MATTSDQTQLQSGTKRLQELRKQHREKEAKWVTELSLSEDQNDTLRGRNDELERGWSKEKESNKYLMNERDTAQMTIENVKDKVKKAESKVEDLSAELEKKDAASEQVAELKKELEQKEAAFTKELKDANDKLAAFTKEKEDFTSKFATVNAEKVALTDKVTFTEAAMKTAVEDLQAKLDKETYFRQSTEEDLKKVQVTCDKHAETNLRIARQLSRSEKKNARLLHFIQNSDMESDFMDVETKLESPSSEAEALASLKRKNSEESDEATKKARVDAEPLKAEIEG